ncbi:SPOSA6832_00119, partial [Sporobolomyces salmonicolor]
MAPHATTPLNWDYFISQSGKRWEPSAIRGLFPLEKIPGMVSLLAGKPNAETFPFSAITVSLKPIVLLHFSVLHPPVPLTPPSPAPQIPTDQPEQLVVESEALTEGLQYGPTAGLGGLVKWLENLQEKRHQRALDGSWRVSVGSGSQDLINKAFCSLINDGDSVLLESPVYSGTLGLLKQHNCDLIVTSTDSESLAEVSVDTAGMRPDALEDILANWTAKFPGKRFPKLLYTIPTGSNPTGCSSPLERREKILSLVRQYNLLLLEDDAYHYLSFDPENITPSYFELEARSGGETGRVVRFDSFSKILSSGMRLGFLTAAKPLVDIVDLHTANTNLQPSSTTQAMVLVLLNKWGLDGFLAHTRRVAAFYKAKRDMFEKVAHKYLDGLASWVSPDAGMFVRPFLPLVPPPSSALTPRTRARKLFLDLHLTTDGTAGDSSSLISTTAVQKGVLAVPGVGFLPNGGVSSFVRVSFSLATEEDAELAFQRLRACVLEARGGKA